MRKLLVVDVVMMAIVVAVAAPSEQSKVMVPVRQLVNGFNQGDIKMAQSACAEQASIIDEFPPYHWSGAGACSVWMDAYNAWAKQNGVTDGAVTLGKTRAVEVSGDNAYLVMVTGFTWKQNGQPQRESGATFTFVLHKATAGWRITAWTWSKP